MAGRPAAPPEVKAAAITQWLAGTSVAEIARQTGFTSTAIASWVKVYARGGELVTKPQTLSKKTDKAISVEPIDFDLLAWGLIHDSIAALHGIYQTAQNREWLLKQDADKLAIFAGVVSDKLLRILSSFERTDT